MNLFPSFALFDSHVDRNQIKISKHESIWLIWVDMQLACVKPPQSRSNNNTFIPYYYVSKELDKNCCIYVNFFFSFLHLFYHERQFHKKKKSLRDSSDMNFASHSQKEKISLSLIQKKYVYHHLFFC